MGRRWVTKEQYVRYFMLCYDLLYEGDDEESSVEVRRASLEVGRQGGCACVLGSQHRGAEVPLPLCWCPPYTHPLRPVSANGWLTPRATPPCLGSCSFTPCSS
jgi:hypothetical protein